MLTNKIVHELKNLSNNRDNIVLATLVNEIMDNYEKELSIPRILPKLSISLDNVLK